MTQQVKYKKGDLFEVKKRRLWLKGGWDIHTVEVIETPMGLTGLIKSSENTENVETEYQTGTMWAIQAWIDIARKLSPIQRDCEETSISRSQEDDKYEPAHKPIVDMMSVHGFGLMKDGNTFYQRGYELDPRTGTCFDMNQAYEIANMLQRNVPVERVSEDNTSYRESEPVDAKVDWEKEFDKEFPNSIYSDLTVQGLTSKWRSNDDIKNFIRTQIDNAVKAATQRVLMVLENIDAPEEHTKYAEGFDDGIKQAIQSLHDEGKGNV